MKIGVSIQVAGVEMMIEFIMSRGSGVSLRECNVM